MAERQQLLEHDRDLLTIRSGQRIELERVAADRQLLVVGGAGDRAVDVRELAAARLAPGPDLWRGVFGRTAHSCGSRSQGCRQAQSRSAQKIFQLALYSRAFQCGQAPLSPTSQECALIGIVAALDRVEREGAAGRGNREGTGEARAQICVISEASERPFQRSLAAVCHLQACHLG